MSFKSGLFYSPPTKEKNPEWKNLVLGFCRKFRDYAVLWRGWVLGVGPWFSVPLTQSGIHWKVLAGLQSPVRKVSEAPCWGPGHTPPSCLAHLLGAPEGRFLMLPQWYSGMPGCPEKPGSHFICSFTTLGAGNPEGLSRLSPGKGTRIPLF